MEIIKGSFDRLEGDYAIVYSDSDSRKFNVPKGLLSEDIKPGARLVLLLEGTNVIRLEADAKATLDARERIRRKYARLQRKKIRLNDFSD